MQRSEALGAHDHHVMIVHVENRVVCVGIRGTRRELGRAHCPWSRPRNGGHDCVCVCVRERERERETRRRQRSKALRAHDHHVGTSVHQQPVWVCVCVCVRECVCVCRERERERARERERTLLDVPTIITSAPASVHQQPYRGLRFYDAGFEV